MNFTDIALIVLIAAAIALAVWRTVVNKKRGKGCSGCCEGCSGCDAKDAVGKKNGGDFSR
ncbi:MAG: FeoB-associated Cys-rich membrane protein [Clostridia bacterium]|nr:FeoB-associated Cys-rich membrane protein [Clostridia bacterium]